VRVLVLVGGASGVPMTGLEPSSGTGDTGDWVADGMIFTLVDATGQELARATAQVGCVSAGSVLPAELSAAPYFPLRVGNQWVYRTNNRAVTSAYTVWRVKSAARIAGQVYFVLEQGIGGNLLLLRPDDQGRVYQLGRELQEVLWFDPNSRSGAGVIQVQSHASFRGPIGSFEDALFFQQFDPLLISSGFLVRGVGLVSRQTQMISGSSGGFAESLELVEARIDDHIRYATAAVSVGLAVESVDLDVSGKRVTNCAIPCYFTACGLVPSTDPPNTYKPCFQTRVRLEGPPRDVTVGVDLLSASDTVVMHAEQVLTVPPDGDAAAFMQMPLYTQPNQPVAAGAYRVRATAESSSAVIPVQIR
jgi:hypothetical protein